MENNMIFISLAQAEIPKMVESTSRDYVLWGENNNYPERLVKYYQYSSLHNAIVKSKINDICGDGVGYGGDVDEATDGFMVACNPYESLDEVIRKVANDLVIFGGYALNVIWSKDKKTVSEIYHVPFELIRSGKANEKGIVEKYYYSDNWSAWKKDMKEIKAFNQSKPGGSQLLFYKAYNPGVKYYPLPSYVGSISAIETDAEIANFHLAHVKNGMTPNLIINFPNGVPTSEERKKIEKQIKDKYVGTDNAGRFIITFSDDKDRAPTVTTLSPAQLDKQFLQLSDSILQSILSGHGVVSPLLVGIPAPVGLGGTEIVKSSWELYHNRVIQPYKDEILFNLNKIMGINGLRELSILTSSPVSFNFSENVLLEILTKDEMREIIGYDPLEQEIADDDEAVDVQDETEVAEKVEQKTDKFSEIEPTDEEESPDDKSIHVLVFEINSYLKNIWKKITNIFGEN
jgi:hypothetical protein